MAERKRRSRDFHWCSPVLKRVLVNSLDDEVIIPNDEVEVVRVLAACYERRIPVTARAGGKGNYGQAMPLAGGIIRSVKLIVVGFIAQDGGDGRPDATARALGKVIAI